jgi:MraZ protein
VSIPAQFRAVLREGAETGELVLRPSHKYASIEAWPKAAFEALAKPMSLLDVFSDEEDDLSFMIYAGSVPARPDGEGRLVLPEALVAHAHLSEQVSFVGLGKRFEIWEPAALAERYGQALQRGLARNLTLPASR